MTAQSIHVAVLDDEPAIRIALSRLLKANDMVVTTHPTAKQFFESLALQIPHCLVLDLQMPEISGLGVLSYLSQQRFRVPTIVITGYDEENSRQDCMNAGALVYLLKPLDAELLVDTIKKICENP